MKVLIIFALVGLAAAKITAVDESDEVKLDAETEAILNANIDRLVGSDGKSLSLISVESISRFLASRGDGTITRKSVDIKGSFMNAGKPTDCVVSILEPPAKDASKCAEKTNAKIKAKCCPDIILTKGDDGNW